MTLTTAIAEPLSTGAQLVATGRAAAAAPERVVIEAASATNEDSLMYQAPYYTEADRGLIDAYDNKFNLSSWEPWLTYDAQAVADRLTVPTLIVCSDAAALPAGAHAFVGRTKAPVTERWLARPEAASWTRIGTSRSLRISSVLTRPRTAVSRTAETLAASRS